MMMHVLVPVPVLVLLPRPTPRSAPIIPPLDLALAFVFASLFFFFTHSSNANNSSSAISPPFLFRALSGPHRSWGPSTPRFSVISPFTVETFTSFTGSVFGFIPLALAAGAFITFMVLVSGFIP